MKTIVGMALVIVSAGTICAQDYDPMIDVWMGRVQIDSLTSFVRILSGEDSVEVGGTMALIERRVETAGKGLAADYIKEKFESYGLIAYDHLFDTEGRNVYAVQTGSTYPLKQFIVCAHYDAVTNFGADDNASGVAAVLETARILSGETLNCTVVYAAWDQEEIGLIGSNRYAARAALNGEDIQGVINLDMIAWDGNADKVCDVHTGNVGTSRSLADLLVRVDSLYSLPIVPIYRTPGTTASDHASFWNMGYGAILLIEAYYGSDFNPYYHSTQDRVDKFDLYYFLNMTKLAVGTVSTLASGSPLVAVDEKLAGVPADYGIGNYPNPFNGSTVVRYELPEAGWTTISVYNTIGEKVAEILNGQFPAGTHEMGFNAVRLSSGLYFLRLSSPAATISSKMILLK